LKYESLFFVKKLHFLVESSYLEEKKIDTNKLILKPNSIYTFERHDVGDAGPFIIKIFTDSKGNIKNSDGPCN
jgi:hypothetical protein